MSYVLYILKKCFQTSLNFKTYLFAYICDFFEVQLICNVVLVSRLQQSDSVIHTHVFFIRFFFHYRFYYALKKKEVELIYGASLVAQMVKNLPAIQETQVQSLGWEDPLEESVAMHSNILCWRIPWTEEPGGVQSIGSHRVRHNWSDLAQHSRELVCRVSGIQWSDETDGFSMW